MGDQPGPLLAQGRDADVFDLGDGLVLRRYRAANHTAESVAIEARIMTWALQHEVPVPVVHDVIGMDLVMELVTGPTMIEDLDRRPWRLVAHARSLARLQRQINALAAPDWLPRGRAPSPGNALLHRDLHSINVLIGPNGPVVIDWTNAARGSPDFDAALSYILMACYELDGWRDRAARRVLVNVFARGRGRQIIRQGLPHAAEFKLSDRNTTPGERAALDRLLAA